MSEIEAREADGDRRVRRTRRALRDALVAVIQEKGYDATTVQDIADRADVGRSTFYAHFEDKEALLVSALQDLHVMTEPGAGKGPSSLFDMSRTMFRQAQRQRPLFRAVFGRFSVGLLYARMEREVFDWVRSELRAIAPAAHDAAVTMAARVTVSAFLGLLRWWLDAEDPPTVDELGDGFVALLLPGMASVLGVAPQQLADR